MKLLDISGVPVLEWGWDPAQPGRVLLVAQKVGRKPVHVGILLNRRQLERMVATGAELLKVIDEGAPEQAAERGSAGKES